MDASTPGGALLRLAAANGRLVTTAEVVVDGLLYANGLAIDERTGYLMSPRRRWSRAALPRGPGVGPRERPSGVRADIAGDNLKLDDAGRLWVASPLANALVVDTKTGDRHTVFQLESPAQESRSRGIRRARQP